jgi:hypothetical protein
MAKERMAQAH